MDSAWGGWSTQWYTELSVQEQILASAWTSLQIAAASATGATLLGVLAALALVRLTRPTARGLLGLLAVVPLVMPPVILGFSLLML
ncbi:MAG: putrescine ABC transporter permease PotI, partial [Lysobacterales bacterium]